MGYPSNIGGFGAVGILKEAHRLLCKHIKLFLPFILAFFLPAALIQLFQTLGMSWSIPHHHHHLHHRIHLHHAHHHSWTQHVSFFHMITRAGMENMDGPGPHPGPPPPGPPIFLVFFVSFLIWLLISLAVAAFSNVVSVIYNDQEADPALTKKVFKSLPHDLLRIFVTSLWILLFTVLVTIAVSIPFGLLGALFKSKHIIFFILNAIFVYIGILLVAFLVFLAQPIAVLEPNHYGHAAIKKSQKLVKEKLPTALSIFVLTIVVSAVLSQLVQLVVFGDANGTLPKWLTIILLIILALLFFAFNVYFLIVNIVLYFSSKTEFDTQNPEVIPEGSDNPYTPLVHTAEV